MVFRTATHETDARAASHHGSQRKNNPISSGSAVNPVVLSSAPMSTPVKSSPSAGSKPPATQLNSNGKRPLATVDSKAKHRVTDTTSSTNTNLIPNGVPNTANTASFPSNAVAGFKPFNGPSLVASLPPSHNTLLTRIIPTDVSSASLRSAATAAQNALVDKSVRKKKSPPSKPPATNSAPQKSEPKPASSGQPNLNQGQPISGSIPPSSIQYPQLSDTSAVSQRVASSSGEQSVPLASPTVVSAHKQPFTTVSSGSDRPATLPVKASSFNSSVPMTSPRPSQAGHVQNGTTTNTVTHQPPQLQPQQIPTSSQPSQTDTNTQSDKPANEDEDSDNSSAPLATVFQCKKCRLIISDSSSWIGAMVDQEGISYFTIKSVVTDSINILPTGRVSNSGPDRGSSFHPIACSSCSSEIGRFYLATPHQVDFARNHYTLDASKMAYYKVGQPGYSSKEASDNISNLLKPSANVASQQFAMMETMIITLYNQVGQLQQKVELMENDQKKAGK